jgi:diaminopimelate epimerase
MTEIDFHKMEGAGNDFIVIDNRETKLSLDKIISLTPKICDRRFGVGADGLLVLEPSQLDNIDYTMIYRNADGSDAGMCGNGGRCLALFASNHGFKNKQTFNVHDKTYTAEVDVMNESVVVSFPNVELPKYIQVASEDLIQVYTGTEHVVQFIDQKKIQKENELTLKGAKIRYDELLNPPGSNVNFVNANNDYSLHLQTYERGVEALTLACGTGAIASAIASHFNNGNDEENCKYTIYVKGGILHVTFSFIKTENMYKNVTLEGPAKFVFEGKINA